MLPDPLKDYGNDAPYSCHGNRIEGKSAQVPAALLAYMHQLHQQEASTGFLTARKLVS